MGSQNERNLKSNVTETLMPNAAPIIVKKYVILLSYTISEPGDIGNKDMILASK